MYSCFTFSFLFLTYLFELHVNFHIVPYTFFLHRAHNGFALLFWITFQSHCVCRFTSTFIIWLHLTFNSIYFSCHFIFVPFILSFQSFWFLFFFLHLKIYNCTYIQYCTLHHTPFYHNIQTCNYPYSFCFYYKLYSYYIAHFNMHLIKFITLRTFFLRFLFVHDSTQRCDEINARQFGSIVGNEFGLCGVSMGWRYCWKCHRFRISVSMGRRRTTVNIETSHCQVNHIRIRIAWSNSHILGTGHNYTKS